MKEVRLLIKGIVAIVVIIIAACGPARSEQSSAVKRSDTARYMSIAATHASGCRYVFIADFSRTPQKRRFFILDMQSHKILSAGLCCSGRTDANGRVMYSNAESSHCSSKGIYKVAERYIGTYGVAYRLDGLSATNSNARRRNVVLHSHECVPEAEDGSFSCQSFGCPTLNPAFFKYVDKLIQSAKGPVKLIVL